MYLSRMHAVWHSFSRNSRTYGEVALLAAITAPIVTIGPAVGTLGAFQRCVMCCGRTRLSPDVCMCTCVLCTYVRAWRHGYPDAIQQDSS
jgi:hypothetical protein